MPRQVLTCLLLLGACAASAAAAQTAAKTPASKSTVATAAGAASGGASGAAAGASASAGSADADGRTAADVGQSENVRTEYARVLKAEPVYQTLRATSMVQQCDEASPVVRDGEEAAPGGLSRVVGAVKDALTPGVHGGSKRGEGPAAAARPDTRCRSVPMNREFRRPIAYDVDYVHHGIRYRSRLPYDPGNRMRVRVSVTPVISSAATP